MRKYSTPLPEPSRTFDANPRASRQAGLDVLLSNRTTWNSSLSTIQGKGSMATHMPLQKAEKEATIEDNWKMSGRSSSNIIYNTSNNALGYWFRNEGSETKSYDNLITLHHIIPVERLKKFWNKISPREGKLRTLTSNLVDIHIEQRKKEIQALRLKQADYHWGLTSREREKIQRNILEKENEIAKLNQDREPLQMRMQSIQREMDSLSQKRPSKSKVSTGFERLKAEKAEVQWELDHYKAEIGKLKLSKTLLLQQYHALCPKIEELDRLKEQGMEEMPDDEFLSTKGTFSNLLETTFTSGGCVLSADEVKQYIQERTAATKDHEKDQIIASLYLWLPGNLVPGPRESVRKGDKKADFDEEAAEIQGDYTRIKALYDKIYNYTDGRDKDTLSDDMENDIIKDIQEILAKGKMNQNSLWLRRKNEKGAIEYVKGS